MHGIRELILVLLVASAVSRLPAQCGLHWEPAGGHPGANAVIRAAAMWDPDGSGPAPRVAVLGGDFTMLGGALASRVGRYDPTTGLCAALGSGTDGPVRALLALPNGDLVVAGSFTQAGGLPAANIARWNGAQWAPVGGGIGGPVRSLLLLPNGDLLAGGSFATAGGAPAANLARWDGVSWAPFHGGTVGAVAALASAPNGDVWVGGDMTAAGGLTVSRLAHWSPAGWVAMNSGCNATVADVVVMPNGDVIVAGAFTQAGGLAVDGAARWNGSTWQVVYSQPGVRGTSVQTTAAGQLVVGTTPGLVGVQNGPGGGIVFPLAGVTVAFAGTASAVHRVLDLGNGELLVVGEFRGPLYHDTMARVFRVAGGGFGPNTGIGWQLGGWVDATGAQLAESPGGEVFVHVASPSTVTPGRVDVWNVSGWTVLGTALGGAGSVSNMSTVGLGAPSNGRVMACGSLVVTVQQPPPFGGIATLNYWGASIGSGPASYFGWGSTSISEEAHAVLTTANGDILVCTSFLSTAVGLLHRFASSGASISIVQPPFAFGAMTELANGDIVGSSLVAPGTLAQGSGTTWSPLGSTLGGAPLALATTPGGDVIAGGAFVLAGGAPALRIARWNGSTWLPLGAGLDGPVHALLALPDGDVLAGGQFTLAGGQPAENLARWDGVSWSPVAGGTNGTVTDLLLARDGTIWVAGAFTIAGGATGVGCGGVARLVADCPASVATFGTGCTGSGGLNTLVATSLPWLGGSFASLATGMPANGFAVAANGWQTWSVPLSSLLPVGVSGCDLRVLPDVLDLYLPAAGAVIVRLPLPSASILVGQQIHQQVVPLELDVFGNLSAMTATNALRLTLGVL